MGVVKFLSLGSLYEVRTLCESEMVMPMALIKSLEMNIAMDCWLCHNLEGGERLGGVQNEIKREMQIKIRKIQNIEISRIH